MNERRLRIIAAGMTYLVIEFSTLLLTALTWWWIASEPVPQIPHGVMGGGVEGRSFLLPQVVFLVGTGWAIYAGRKEYRRVEPND
ncbi:MAG: hypothetical protein RL441_143 [Actinomycetota bacterium]